MLENNEIKAPEPVTLDIVTDDSGMYGSYMCSNCSWSTKSHEEAHALDACPNCKLPISGTREVGYPFGGSDY